MYHSLFQAQELPHTHPFLKEKYLNEKTLSEFCHISPTCAHTRIGVLNRFREEINSHPLYSKLPEVQLII